MATPHPIHSPPVISPPPQSPPSLTSSPSHEFSFTISLSSSSTSLKLSKPPRSFADFDLAPADDLFFRGHLLPLHFLSHRPSTASVETDHKLCNPMDHKITPKTHFETPHLSSNQENFKKATPFSTFFNPRKWGRGGENRAEEKQSMRKKKSVFGGLWRKYASFIEPLWFFKVVREKREFRRGSYSFSGGGDGGWRRRWRGDFSAPASKRNSPANSGILVAPTSAFCSSDESTMEELQNAIQAAIAHCKSSSGAVREEKGGD